MSRMTHLLQVKSDYSFSFYFPGGSMVSYTCPNSTFPSEDIMVVSTLFVSTSFRLVTGYDKSVLIR